MRILLMLMISIIVLSSCQKDYYGPRPDNWASPEVRLRASSVFADTTTWFTFYGQGSRDCQGLWGIIDFRWDLNGDGSWDTPFTRNEEWVHVYPVPGKYLIILQVRDRYGVTSSDSLSIETYGANKDLSSFIDPRDGQAYKTARFNNIQWMAENLNIGALIPVYDTACDNGIIEKYSFDDDPDLKSEKGGFYTYYDWEEMMNYDTIPVSGICPPGWELPTSEDWITLLTAFPLDYFAVGGFSNLNLTGTGFQPRYQDWEMMGLSPGSEHFTYFTRDFYKGYLNGPDKLIPTIVSSQINKYRGMSYPIQYYNDSIKKYMGIAPVRCVKRD